MTIDAGIHVPLIVQGPGVQPVGSVCDDLVDFSDFLPTLAELCGVPIPPSRPIDGVSFRSQLRGEPGRKRRSAYCYYNPRPGKKRFPETRFAHDGRWKLYRDGRLFDVTRDVLEKEPLPPGQNPETKAARKKLQAVLDRMPAEPKKISRL